MTKNMLRKDSNMLLNLQHPRQRLSKLCKKTTGGQTLVISNSYLSEAIDPTFHEFFDQFREDCGVEKMFFGADSEEQAIDMCKFKKVARGLTLENHGPLSVRPLMCKVVYKEAINKQMFVHGKSGVCFNKECREVWAIVGSFNFSCAAWAKKEESPPKNFEVSVFLCGDHNRLRELLRVQHEFVLEKHKPNNIGLGWTLSEEFSKSNFHSVSSRKRSR
jgi:hypothetical protein